VPVTSAAGVPRPACGVPDPSAALPDFDPAEREHPQADRPLIPVPAPAAEIAAQTTRLITLCYGTELSAADQDELEHTVLAQVEAALVLRRYPLLNSDEPMLATGQEPGWLR
jgi:hypothetical protein